MLFSFRHPKPVVSSRPVAEMLQKHRITPVDPHTLSIQATEPEPVSAQTTLLSDATTNKR